MPFSDWIEEFIYYVFCRGKDYIFFAGGGGGGGAVFLSVSLFFKF